MFESKLENRQTDELVDLLLCLETREECYRLLEDLFTFREIRDLAQRIEVAQLLTAHETYADIAARTGVSSATIGRVNRALVYGADGYKTMLEKLAKKHEENHD